MRVSIISLNENVCNDYFFFSKQEAVPAPAPAPTPATERNIAMETDTQKEQEAEVDPHAVTPRSQVNLEATATGD